MPRRAGRTAAALIGAALLVAPAHADVGAVTPGALVPALDVYVDAMIAGHNVALVCAAKQSRARNDAEWQQAKAIFTASLWAGGFPIDFVRTVTQRLDAKPASASPNCKDTAVTTTYEPAEENGWVSTVEKVIEGIALTPVATPATPAQWTGIKAAIDKELPLEQHMLDCVAVSRPASLPRLVHDWDQMMARIAVRLDAAGLPRDEISAELSGAAADSLWHRAAPDVEAELRDSCSKDHSWRDRVDQLGFGGLESTIEHLLPAPPGPGGS